MNKPLYQRIFNELVSEIEKGVYTEGSRLPSESELCQQYNVSRITAKHALDKLEEQNYVNRIKGKGSFVKARKNAPVNNKILFILPDHKYFSDTSVNGIVKGLRTSLNKMNYEIIMVSPDYLERQTPDSIIQDYAGIIYYVYNNFAFIDLFFYLKKMNFPIVLIDKPIAELSFPVVTSDNYSGGILATRHLINFGHTHIGFIFQEKRLLKPTLQRYLGYLDELANHNLLFHSKYLDIALEDVDDSVLLDYLERNEITGLICENDDTAISLIQILESKGASVPDDISIIGFDNIYAGTIIQSPLSTIAQNFIEIGESAGNLLLEVLSTPDAVVESRMLKVHLVVRESSKRLETE